MKYYKVNIKRRFPEQDRVLGHANGEFVSEGKSYFSRMGDGEIILDAPVFDYFHLQSYGPKEEWEWRLQDVHGFIGEYPTGASWYISDRFKRLLKNFCIAEGHHFYATRLLYKGEKLDYWIFQYAIKNKTYVKDAVIDFEKSIFYNEVDDTLINVENYDEFKVERKKIEEGSNYSKDLITKKLVLKNRVDFLPLFGINNSGEIVSENLKQAIEEANLIGLEFKELNYEVEVLQPA